MSSEKPSFLSQPVVKNIFMFRNGDPYYEARRIVVNEKRVCNFETLLREVTGGIQAPFGAVRTIYTPRGGHKVDCMESLQSGEQYVAAGRERFKRLDYVQIGTRKKRMMQTLTTQTKPLPPNRISVSARFLKPIKEPCPIFVVANGDILNPAMRLLIHQRMLGQFDRILEMITEKMGLRVLGGVRSLYTCEGLQVTDGEKLESGHLYVAVGRERFKKLLYSDLLFSKPRGARINRGRKTYSLPPLYRFSNSKQSGNSKSEVPSSNSEDRDFRTSPLGLSNTSKEHLSSIVREISQSKLLSLRKRKSGQSFNPYPCDDDDSESKVNDGSADHKIQQDKEAVEELDGDVKAISEKEEVASENTEVPPLSNGDNKEDLEEKDEAETKDEYENSDEKNRQDEMIEENHDDEATTVDDPEKAEEKEGCMSENTTEEDALATNEGKGERPEEGGEKVEDETKEADESSDQSRGGAAAAAAAEEQEEEVDAQQKTEVTDGRQEEINSKEQRSSSANSDKTQENKNDGSLECSGVEEEHEGNQDEDKQELSSGDREERSNDHVNDVNTGEQKEIKNSNDSERPQSAKESKSDASSIVNGNQEEASQETGESQEGKVNGEVAANDDEVEREAQLDRKNSAATMSQ
uniref:Doublecortin domain-containing protein 2 n=1 Tax=Oryzias latipes TaxID=8090 RepID=A0A3P9JUI9_ORYLA